MAGRPESALPGLSGPNQLPAQVTNTHVQITNTRVQVTKWDRITHVGRGAGAGR